VGAAPGKAPSDAAALESDFFAHINLVRAAREAGFAADRCADMGVNGVAARQVWRTADFFLGVARQARLTGADGGPRADRLLRAVLTAFPDRLARRRDQGTLVCTMRDGRRAELARESTVRGCPLVVAADVRESVRPGEPARLILSLASEVRPEWLQEEFPDGWKTEQETVWDDRARQVIRRRRTSCLGLVLEESAGPETDPARAAPILAPRVRDGSLPLARWDDTVTDWMARVRWVAERFPERNLITYDEADLDVVYDELCAGAVSYRQIRDRPCLDVVRGVMSYDDQQFVERMAPAAVHLPGGRRVRLAYRPGQAPRGRAFLQDLYDLRQTPRIAGGTVAVLLEIQAPNRRTVQITDDMEAFWRDHYPGIRREFARRYPKHEWR
jgi:ATP-dependent helicase HrpB